MQITSADLDAFCREDFLGTIDFLVEKCAAPADILRQSLETTFTSRPIDFYWDPLRELSFMQSANPTAADVYLCKQAAIVAFGSDRVVEEPIPSAELLDDWQVKIAVSPTIRRLGELAHVFPSRTPITGLEGKPIAAMLASGLLGTGLGYGAGWLGEKVLPESWQTKGTLRKRLAMLGGMAGSAVGAVPGLINWHEGRSFNDPTLFAGHSDSGFDGQLLPDDMLGINFKKSAAAFAAKFAEYDMSTMGGPIQRYVPTIPLNSLGEVVGGANVDPSVAMMTLGAVYSASQLGGPRNMEAATPHQMGLLGTAIGTAGGGIKGYLTGYAVGKGLGLLTGLPEEQQKTLQRTGLVAGMLGALATRLFQ
jgi:hypothetical protein